MKAATHPPAERLVRSVRSVRSATLGMLFAVLVGAAHAAELTVATTDLLPANPQDPAWQKLPDFPAPLIPQDMVEPRLLAPSTPQVMVRAFSDGKRIAFRLEWDDATNDDLPGTGRFSDACAVQMPAKTDPNVPAPQMGEPGRPVEVVYWRAAWQATVAGRPDDIKAIHPGATVDHYPFEAPSLKEGSADQAEMEKRYAPARALDNPMAGPRAQPVQDLVAEGPGTLSPAEKQTSAGRGARTAKGWSVVLTRPMPEGLAPGGRSQIAFAVWEGSRQEVGAKKMRSVWIPIAMEAK